MVTTSHLMKRPLVSVEAGTSVAEAAKLMREKKIGSGIPFSTSCDT